MSECDYDLFNIGGGSAGTHASRFAAQYGARVALAERQYLGGTCVKVCGIPKQLMSYATHSHDDLIDARGFGREVGETSHDWATLIAIMVDKDSRTNVPSIYAIGDVIDRVVLKPLALAEGMVVASALFENGVRKISYDNIPTAVFSHPNVGTVGLNEEEARKQYGDVKIFKSEFKALKHTLSGSIERALMKMVADVASDRVLGAHMVGADAGEIMQGFGSFTLWRDQGAGPHHDRHSSDHRGRIRDDANAGLNSTRQRKPDPELWRDFLFVRRQTFAVAVKIFREQIVGGAWYKLRQGITELAVGAARVAPMALAQQRREPDAVRGAVTQFQVHVAAVIGDVRVALSGPK